MAVNTDAELERAYIGGGYPAVENALQSSETIEVNLNAIGVHHEVGLTGDTRLGASLLHVKPPGLSSVLPTDVLDAGRMESRDLHRQEQRSGGSANTATVRQRRASWFAQPTGKGPKAGAKEKGKGKGGRGRGAGGAPEDEE
jgi:hypothetical protein